MSSIDSKDFPSVPFPASYASDFRIYFDSDIYRQINEHVRAETSHEVGGILVGLWQKDENGPYATVIAMIRCDKAVGREGEVTFTHETWNDIAREMDGPYLDYHIVGWYHSHPGFGVFLSERDLFIQEHFFSNAGQVALVIDPLSETEGVFYWKEGKVTPSDCFWVGKKLRISREDAADAGAHPKTKISAEEVGTRRGASATETDPPPLFSNTWFSLLVLVTLCMFMFVLGGFLKPRDQLDYRQRLLEGAILDYCFMQGKRPDLELFLLEIDKDLHQARLEVKKLQEGETVTVKKGDKEEKKKLDPIDAKRIATLVDRLQKSQEKLRVVQSLYCLNEKEKLGILQQIAEKLNAVVKMQEEQKKKEQEKKNKTQGKDKQPNKKQPPKNPDGKPKK